MSYTTDAQFKEVVEYLSQVAEQGFYSDYQANEKSDAVPTVQISKFKDAQDGLIDKMLNNKIYSEMLNYWKWEAQCDPKKYGYKPHRTEWGDLKRYATETDIEELKDAFKKVLTLLRSAQFDWDLKNC